MEDAAQTWRRRFGTPLLVTPVCRELMDWAKERWEQSRKNQPIGDDGQELDPHMPREWQKMASQVFQLGPQVAVRGTSCKFPASYSDAGFWCGAEAGCDLIEEVPLCRWDHSKFYDEDLDSFKWCKTSCQHASFIDGIELFDNKFFGISPAESKGMDPMQRHILETSYEALYFSGLAQHIFRCPTFLPRLFPFWLCTHGMSITPNVFIILWRVLCLRKSQFVLVLFFWGSSSLCQDPMISVDFWCLRWLPKEDLDEVTDWCLRGCLDVGVCLCPAGGLFDVRYRRGQQYHLESHFILLGYARHDCNVRGVGVGYWT